MLIVRLKQFEHALADGRLDQAYEMAKPADLRADRRGQDLVTRLAEELTRRGREQAEAGRLAEASADCEKAAALAGNDPEIARLRAVVASAAAAKLEGERNRNQQIAAAKRQIDAGQLTVGQGLLAAVEDEESAERLGHDLAARRALLRSAVDKATAALAADDWQTAVDHLAGIAGQFPADGELCGVTSRITQHVGKLITNAIETGRLDLAGHYLARLDRLDRSSVELEPARRTLLECQAASELIGQSDSSGGIAILRRLALLWPDAKWIEADCERLKQVSRSLEELRSGPLGLMSQVKGFLDPHETLPMPPRTKSPHRRLEPVPTATAGRFFLHVDGIGGFAVIEKPVVSIGPVSSVIAPDVALLAGAELPQISISRTDGDYFLQAAQPVLVNEKPTTSKLLTSGDKIALGPRCRFAFRRPSAASGSAMLDLTGARLARGDVRQIILLDREILIGPGSAAHVRCDALAQPAVLQPSGGRIVLRSAEAVQIDGQAAPRPAQVSPGEHVRIGPVSFVVTKE